MEFELNNDYLAHHGIKGQKWGIRRYQNEDGSLTQLGRQRRGISDKSVREKIKDKVSKLKEEKAAKAKETEAEKHEALKEHVRKHPSRLYKYRTEFSDDEIRDLTNKIRTDTALKDIRDAEIQRGWNKMQQFSQNLGKIKGLAENAKGMYNLMAEVNNVLVDSGKVNGKRMLKIGEKPEEKKVDKAALLRNMSVDDILKNQKAFTANELAEYVKWSNSVDILNKKVASSIPEVKSTEDLVNDIVDNLPKTANWYSGRDPDWYVSHDALGTNVEDISESDDHLAHFGILGMKWGVRRFQKKDGTLTEAGKARYNAENEDTKDSDTTDPYNRETLKNELKKNGFKENEYGDYEKVLKSPDKNIKELTICVDSDKGFSEPGMTNEELLTLTKDIEKNIKSVNRDIKTQMADYAEKDPYSPWSWEDSDLSKDELKKQFAENLGGFPSSDDGNSVDPGYVSYRIMQDGYGEVGYDDGGAYYGHYLMSEIDWKTKKLAGPYSVNG